MYEQEALDQIIYETDNELESGSAKAMSDIIFDTLMENTQFPQFDIDRIDGDANVDSKKGLIWFNYAGHNYRIKVELVD